MSEDKVIALKNPGTPAPVADALTEILRVGAQRMLAAAIEAEVSVFLEGFMGQETAEGREPRKDLVALLRPQDCVVEYTGGHLGRRLQWLVRRRAAPA